MSLPEPPFSVSLPPPPDRRSAPAPPFRVSLPPRPSRMSVPLVPLRMLLPLLPIFKATTRPSHLLPGATVWRDLAVVNARQPAYPAKPTTNRDAWRLSTSMQASDLHQRHL